MRKPNICKTRKCQNNASCKGFCVICYKALKRYGNVHGKPYIFKQCKGCGKKFETNRDSALYCKDRKCYRSDPENKTKQAGYLKAFRQKKLITK